MEPVQIHTEGGVAEAEIDGAVPSSESACSESPSSESRVPWFLLVLTHGAGGSAAAPDLLAARDAGLRLGGLVARVTQPYRVRGARAPGAPERQDAAWAEVVAALRELAPGAPLVQGGRSNGAR